MNKFSALLLALLINSILEVHSAIIQTGYDNSIQWGKNHIFSSSIFNIFPRSEVFRINFKNPMFKIPQIMIVIKDFDWEYGFLVDWNIEIQEIDK